MIPVALPTLGNPGRFGEDGANRLINTVLEPQTVGGKSVAVIYPRPGLTDFATLTGASGGGRALFELDNTLYAVSGRQVYSSTTDGSITQLTGGISADGPVYHARNMASIPMVALVSGGTLTLLQGGTLTEISDADLPPPVDAAFLSGYLIFPTNDGRFFWSAINDIDVDALDFASAEYSADRIMRSVSHRNELWFIGADTVEVWGVTGASDAPFQRIAVRDGGCRAAGSVVQVAEALMWVNKRGQVVRTNGYDATPVSTHAVDRDIAGVNPSTITATTFDLNGHSYYILSCPTWTWVYDVGYRSWSQWQTHGADRWNIAACVAFDNTVIAIDSEVGSLYEISTAAHDDAGDDLTAKIQFMTPQTYPKKQRVSAVYCNAIAGRGLITGATEDTDPVMMLRASRDGGKTWPVYQERSAGVIGARNTDIVFRKLGLSGRIGTTLELSMSAAVGRGWVGVAVEMDAG